MKLAVFSTQDKYNFSILCKRAIENGCLESKPDQRHAAYELGQYVMGTYIERFEAITGEDVVLAARAEA